VICLSAITRQASNPEQTQHTHIEKSKMENTQFRLIEATEADVPEMMELQFAACEGDPFHLAI
jgi:hypothetical protein